MLNLVKHKSTLHRFLEGSCVFAQIQYVKELDILVWEEIDGIVISNSTISEVVAILKQVRKNKDLKRSMIPILLDSSYTVPKEVSIHLDGFYQVGSRSFDVSIIKKIHHKLSQLPIMNASGEFGIVTNKLLSYLYSRGNTITPCTSRTAHSGYCFPLVDLFFKNEEPLRIFKFLEGLEQEGLLQKNCIDHIHLCKSCEGSYLNFREICPKCFSIDISVHDMIHHFVCAHVAPEKDFKTEHGLECPKCDKTLRHIGIDYDKPSSVFHCNSCLHEFQNPEMRGFCFDCNTENQLSELLHKTIGSYSITQKGEEQLLDQSNPVQHPPNTNAIGFSEPIFRLLVEQERQRNCNHKTQSLIGSISFFDPQLEAFNKDLKKALQKEIGTIIKAYLEPSDILSVMAYNKYYFLLPDTTEEMPERLSLIEYNLTKLLSDNLNEETIQIMIKKEPLKNFKNSTEVFSKI